VDPGDPDPDSDPDPQHCLKVLSNGINRSILIKCLVGKYPFPALNGHHHFQDNVIWRDGIFKES
jgi:hypothetical protein